MTTFSAARRQSLSPRDFRPAEVETLLGDPTQAAIAHQPVQQAMNRIRQLSADEEARKDMARNLLAMNLLTDAQIATAAGLSEAAVQALRDTAA